MKKRTEIKRVKVKITKDHECGLKKGEVKTLRARVANALVKEKQAEIVKEEHK